jgi:hypothetical protein
MLRRTTKQLSYAAGYVTVLLVLIVSVVVVRRVLSDVPQVTPEPTFVFEPLVVEETHFIHHGLTVDLVARLRNPNPRAGIARLPVDFVLKDQRGEEIVRHQESTYVLPGSIHYVVAVNVATPPDVRQVSVSLPSNIEFTRIPAAVATPSFSSFLRERLITTVGTKQLEEQKGVIRNTSTLDWEKVEVAGVALDAAGRITGVGKTFVGELKAEEQREFTLQWPVPVTATQRVIVLPSTNIYQQENIIRAIGDPASLR